ncbi:ATP-binding protein [Alloscardovia venturai]|uniref:ATP-binding protein n=1 Tax=Alloscardovia venturai TaxID=1769421 RepID=A0ABW2Y451_9BIFI
MILNYFQHTGYIFELLGILGLYLFHVEKRENFFARMIASGVGAVLIASVWEICIPETNVVRLIIRGIIFYGLAFAAAWICAKITWRQAAFYLAGTVALQHVAYSCAQIVIVTFPAIGKLLDRAHIGWLEYPLLFVVFVALGGLLFVRPLHALTPRRIGTSFVLIAVCIMLCVSVFSTLFDAFISTSHIQNSAYFMFVLTRLVTCIFLLSLLREITDRDNAQRDNEFLQQLLAQQREKLAADKETIELINIKTHDLKKQLNVLDGRISREEIDDLKDLVDIYDSSIRTGNGTLDVLLANRSLILEQRGIQFDRMIDGTPVGFMTSADIYSLFGNAMDNAMEAVSKLTDPKRKWIRVKGTVNRGMYILHVENPFDGLLKFEDELPQTTKADKNYHGFGMKSMHMIAEKYNGYMNVTAADGIFTLDIMVPLQ